MRVLVTGGAGFIGSHRVDRLVECGHELAVFDSMEAQVHGGRPPEYLTREAKLVVGDVSDRDWLAPLVIAADAVLRLAAENGLPTVNIADIAECLNRKHAGAELEVTYIAGLANRDS